MSKPELVSVQNTARRLAAASKKAHPRKPGERPWGAVMRLDRDETKAS
jgi:hypothetical protein